MRGAPGDRRPYRDKTGEHSSPAGRKHSRIRPSCCASQRFEDIERRHMAAVLEETGWRVSDERGAAGILGLKRTTLEARMKKLGIVRPA